MVRRLVNELSAESADYLSVADTAMVDAFHKIISTVLGQQMEFLSNEKEESIAESVL